MNTSDRDSYLVEGAEAWNRFIFAILSLGLILLVFTSLGFILTLALSGFLSGFGFGIFVVGLVLPYFIVNVPQATLLYTLNYFRQANEEDRFYNQHVYMTGLHFKYPWEVYEKNNFINGREQEQTFDENIPAGDGVVVKIKGMVVFRASPSFLPYYIAVNDTVIKDGIVTVILAFLVELIGFMEGVEARRASDQIQLACQRIFAILKTQKDRDLERFFGIVVSLVRIKDVDFDVTFQSALTGERIAERLEKATASLVEKANVEASDALNAAMLAFGELKVTKEVKEIKIDGLKTALEGGVSILGAFTEALKAKKQGENK